MKRLLVCLIVTIFLLSGLLISSCAPKAPPVLPKSVAIGANPAGTSFFVYAAGIAEVAGKRVPFLVKHMPMEGPTAWLPMLATGEAQFGIQNMVDAGHAYRAQFGYKEAYPNLRIAFVALYSTYGLAVRGDSGIKTIPDLRGKKVCAEYKAHLVALVLSEAELANAGLTWADVVKVPTLSAASSLTDVIGGRADAGYASVGMAALKELEAKYGARVLPIDPSPAAVARMKKACPGVDIAQETEDSAGTKKGDWHLALNVNLMVGENVGEQVVYEMVKAIWENYKELAPVHPAFKTTAPEKMVSTAFSVPFHPGAIKFFKEKGVWTSDIDKLQKELLKEAKR